MKTDLRQFLSIPLAYDLFQRAVGRRRAYNAFIRQFVQPRPGMSILDIGCGTGEILDYLPAGITYKGYDLSQEYIDSARQKYATNAAFTATFAVGNAADCVVEPAQTYDVAMAVALLHHLDDAAVSTMLTALVTTLKPGGRFVSFDGVYTNNQSRMARRMLDSDRGQHVRTEDQYLKLLKQHFNRVEHTIAHDLLRIPYTHIMMSAQKS